MFRVEKQATVLAPCESGDRLLVVLTDPRGEREEALLVPIRGLTPRLPFDSACLIHAGSHAFVESTSWADYAGALIATRATIASTVQRRLVLPHETCSPALHAHIARGLVESRHAAPKLVRFYKADLELPA